MATHLTVTATHDGSVTNRELREAVRGIDAVEGRIDTVNEEVGKLESRVDELR